MHNIIIKPIVTEKAMQGSTGNYTFMVEKNATKGEIKKAFKENFGVNVISITTNKIKGKRQIVGSRRVEVTKVASKKATIILKKGEKLSIFESGEDKEKKKNKKK